MKTTANTLKNLLARTLVSAAQKAAVAGGEIVSWLDAYQPKTPDKLRR